MRTDKAPKSMAARRRKFQHQLEMLERRERQNERARWHSRPALSAEQRMRRETAAMAARARVYKNRADELALFRRAAKGNGYEADALARAIDSARLGRAA